MMNLERGVYDEHGHGPSGEPVVSVVDGHGTRLLTIPVPGYADHDTYLYACRVFLDIVSPEATSRLLPTDPGISRRQSAGRRRTDQAGLHLVSAAEG